MGAAELLALSLGLSTATAATAWIGGRLVEALNADPGLRDRVWGTLLALPALPPLAVGLMLLTPPPVEEVAAPTPTLAVPLVMDANVAAATMSAPAGIDASLIAPAILVFAGALALWRLGQLAIGAARLARLVARLEKIDAATAEMVEMTARRLSVQPPRAGVSRTAPEPMLAGWGRARLILPAGPTSRDPAVAQAVLAHELVHLKRGDHRTLWLEEILLALLAVNPLMAALRERRAAAREEACDAAALAAAGPETRRAYAEFLIHALRRRAAPQALPALTFTGARRRTAMRRLKAVMSPAAPAGRRSRLLAAGAALAVAAATGAGSLAVAGEREAVVRLAPPASTAAAADTAPPASPRPRFVASRPGPDAAASAAARQAAADAFSSLTPDQQERFRDPTAIGYRAICASGDPADGGFCAGVMFSFLHEAPANGVCPPAAVMGDAGDRGSALAAYVDGGKSEVARLRPASGETVYQFAGRALRAAYPCDAVAAAGEGELAARGSTIPVGPLATSTTGGRLQMSSLEMNPAGSPTEHDNPAPAGQTTRDATPPAGSAESTFLADRRAEREETRQAWPTERGLRLPGWPRPDVPSRRSPFYNERLASQPQNERIPRS